MEDHKCCDCHKPIGGPADTYELCNKCGQKWTRHRGGSWDWEHKDCPKCFDLGEFATRATESEGAE